jgi:CDP-diacylglycerol--serine O-phosphatidyltransferase
MEKGFDPSEEGHTERRRLRRLRRPLPVRSITPNVLTILALCAGLTAIRFALENDFKSAIGAIVIAAFLDGLDGRVARLLKGATKFGAELDSLSDFANFGVVPVMVLYLWTLDTLGGIGWIVVLAFSICCALRLARFNVMVEDPDRPAWKRNYFVGVPAPAAAGLTLMPFFISFLGGEGIREYSFLIAVYVGFIAFLMVSRTPTFSGKGFKVGGDQVLPLLLGVALFAALLLIYAWHTLLAIGVLYLSSIPLSIIRHRRNETKSKTLVSDTASEDEPVE